MGLPVLVPCTIACSCKMRRPWANRAAASWSEIFKIVVEVVVDLLRLRSRWRRFGRLAVLLRGRDAYPQSRCHRAAELRHRRKHDDDLSDPVRGIISVRAAYGTIVSAVQNK